MLITCRTAPTQSVDCPVCQQTVRVKASPNKADVTNVPRVDEHMSGSSSCPGSLTPIAFVPGRFAVVAFFWDSFWQNILAVSRKTDLNDMGLPGGKADPLCPLCGKSLSVEAYASATCPSCGPVEAHTILLEDPYTAVVRETLEETGIQILKADYVFYRADLAQPGDTRPTLPALCFFVSEWAGTATQAEAGRVAWVDPQEVLQGSFREYNADLFRAIGFFKPSRPNQAWDDF